MIYFIPWHKIKLEKLQGHNIIPMMGYKFDLLLLVSLLLYYYEHAEIKNAVHAVSRKI